MPVAFGKDNIPTLPDLPPEFDAVIPPDGLDVFSPSTTPAQEAVPNVNASSASSVVDKVNTSGVNSANVVPTQKTTAVNTSVNKPVTNVGSTSSIKSNTVSSSQKSTMTPVKSTNSSAKSKPVQNITKSVQTVNTNNSYYKNNTKTLLTVPKGKKFHVVLKQSISSSTPAGTVVSFVSTHPETSTYLTIPAGTVFKGKITDSHLPQITGNGGLIVINVSQMIHRGKAYNIDAKISVADDKRIFFNNIKGKRMYFQSIPISIKPGQKYFKKMWRVTKKLAKNESGVEIILTPFSFLAGTVVYGVNVVASPVLALFYKGKSITIPKNSPFVIQLREDAQVLK